MARARGTDSPPQILDPQSEIARALRLSASLNDPADHAVVAEYIAELESAAIPRAAEAGPGR